MSPELTSLEEAVAENKTISGSAVILIKGLADRLAEAGTDPSKLNALVVSLRQDASELGKAITENTPAA